MNLISGLIFQCPMRNAHPDCPFKNIRSMAVKDRIKCIHSLKQIEINKMMIHHKACLRKREESILFKKPNEDLFKRKLK